MLAARGCRFPARAARAMARCPSPGPSGPLEAAAPPMADIGTAPPGRRGGWGRPMYQGLSSGRVWLCPLRAVESTSATSGQSSPVCWVTSAR